MKTKRKVQLSGYWWYPVRKFEFSTQQTLDEVIENIQSLDEKSKSENKTSVTFTRKDADGQHSFRLRSSAGRGLSVIINGDISHELKGMIVQGRAKIGNMLNLVIVVIFQFVLLGVLSFPYGNSTMSLFGLIIWGYFIFCWLMMYGWVVYNRDEKVAELLEAVQAEKPKVEHRQNV